MSISVSTPPQVLQGAGYTSYAVGKWHLGFKRRAFTPTYRGFETWFGYYHWGEGYWQHVRAANILTDSQAYIHA